MSIFRRIGITSRIGRLIDNRMSQVFRRIDNRTTDEKQLAHTMIFLWRFPRGSVEGWKSPNGTDEKQVELQKHQALPSLPVRFPKSPHLFAT